LFVAGSFATQSIQAETVTPPTLRRESISNSSIGAYGIPEAGLSETKAAVIRHVLSSNHPRSAPGETLELVQYIIPAGAVLPVHMHPGVQMATVESGTLTYHVVSHGSADVSRANGIKETIEPGASTTFAVGDSWVEPVGMVHYAENLTEDLIVLISTSLLDDSQPPTELVD
jgi:quercetin dioxygenase-like cupin family protein